jgi:hypothetical protein
VTSDGPEASGGPAYWIESIAHVTGGSRAALAIEARDA